MSGPPLSLDVFTVSASSLFQVDGSELELLQHLHDSVYQQTQDWYQRLGSRIREQINRQYGTMPDKEENIQVWAFAKGFFLLLNSVARYTDNKKVSQYSAKWYNITF